MKGSTDTPFGTLEPAIDVYSRKRNIRSNYGPMLNDLNTYLSRALSSKTLHPIPIWILFSVHNHLLAGACQRLHKDCLASPLTCPNVPQSANRQLEIAFWAWTIVCVWWSLDWQPRKETPLASLWQTDSDRESVVVAAVGSHPVAQVWVVHNHRNHCHGKSCNERPPVHSVWCDSLPLVHNHCPLCSWPDWDQCEWSTVEAPGHAT